ncbi:putative ankyrin repeat protein RF_0381 [Physella acuta]|uniref:putative ankyrin repeat protein RF_0381 n=1 Tax=Physella acuta TaxID=109671 RepID=UPI0027DE591E|nr:putative ankyrin repeat protein RF_0381 [Physella acuta]
MKFGSLELLKLLIDHGADVNALDTEKNPVLSLALNNKSKEIASLLVQKGADVNVSSNDHVPCLLEAIKLGDVEIIKSITQKGADLKQTDADGNTCLHIAVYIAQDQGAAQSPLPISSLFQDRQSTVSLQNHQYIMKHMNDRLSTEVLQLLLDNKADVNLANNKGRTVLHYCVKTRRLEQVKLLLEAGADVNIQNSDHKTPVHIAAHLFCCTDTQTDLNISVEAEILQALLVPAAKVNIADKSGNTVLHYVVLQENLDIVHRLLDAGADVRMRNNFGETVLHFTARYQCNKIMTIILNMPHISDVIDVKDGRLESLPSKRRKLNSYRQSNIHILDTNFTSVEDYLIQSTGKTALMLALENGREDMAFKLLSCGASVDVNNDNGYTALHFAVFKSSIEIVRHLIQAGCNVNDQSHDGDTPLMLARNKDILNILIDAGAEINSKNHCGIKALHTAICRGDVESVDILISKGSVINEATPELLPPLTLAACLKEIKIIKRLLKAGADVNKLSSTGISPVMAASTNVTDIEMASGIRVNSSVFEILYNYGANFNLTDNKGQTALIYLIKHEIFLEKFLKYFIWYGADLEINDRDERSALTHCVLQECDYQRVTYSEMLLQAGVNPLVGVNYRHLLSKHELGGVKQQVWLLKAEEYRPTYEIIIRFGHFNFLRMLIYNGVVLKPSSPNQNTPKLTALMLSIHLEKVDLLKFLIATSYMTLDDLKNLSELSKINLKDRRFGTNNQWPLNADIFKIVKSAMSQPWSLFKLALITFSTTLGESPDRNERLSQIHLPPKLKSILTFQTPIAKLPVSEWSKISLF